MTTATIESSLAELAELRHRLMVEGQNGTLAASIRESVESLPPDVPEVCRAFGAEVLKSIAPARAQLSREVQAIAADGVRLPLRAPAIEEVPGHVTPLPETHHGLVHGGIVQARGFRLVVKAYRFFEHTMLYGTYWHFIDMVAGVCDRFDESGKLVDTWSTGSNAERIESWYASTSVVLPPPPCQMSRERWHGFYRPATATVDGPDPGFYTGEVFSEPPPPAAALENALFTASARSSSGFVIDTPYVSVFSLGPDSPSMIVTLPRVFRLVVRHYLAGVVRFERKAGWEVKLFSA